MPEVYDQFLEHRHHVWSGTTSDMQDMEFTIERGKLFMLQTRNGKRTAQAAHEDRRAIWWTRVC